MYTNNQNCGYNINDNRNNYYSTQHMNHGYNQDCHGPNVNHGYNHEMNKVGCRCDAHAQKGIAKMNEELKRLNKVNLLPEKLILTMGLAQDNANKLRADTFLPYVPDPTSIYSNFQQLRLAILRSDDYYDRAVEQLIKGYECCKNTMDKNSSCWYTKQYNCEQYLVKIKEIKDKIAPKRSLLLQTLQSTADLATGVNSSEAVVLAKTTGVRLPLGFAVSLMNDQIEYLIKSYDAKYSAYDCCKKQNSHGNCNCDEQSKSMCDCKELFTESNESLANANEVGDLANNQIILTNEAFKQYINSIEKGQQARTYVYAAMRQSSDLSRDINELWEEAYHEAYNLFNCCSNEIPGASCCSPNCDKFLAVADRLQELARDNKKEAEEADVRMHKSIDDATAINLKELEYAKEAQIMTTNMFMEYSSIASEITSHVLPMMDDAYNCCAVG